MFNSKYSNFLTVLLVIVIIAIIGLLGFLGYDYYNKYVVEKDTKGFVDDYEDILKNGQTELNNITNNITNQISNGVSATNEINPTPTNSNSTGNKQVKYKGYDVVGTIEIPKTNVKYPILSKATTKAIQVAVGLLYGPRSKSTWKYSYSRA